MSAPSTTVPRAQLIEDPLSNQAVVQIALKRNKLHLYPQRTADTVIYHVTDPTHASPARPHEVRWVVTGLKRNQEIRIEARSEQGLLDSDVFSIPADCNTIVSGPPRRGAGHGRELHWKYDLILLQDGEELERIDPIIVIKDDP